MHKLKNKSRTHKKNRYKGGNTDLHKAILRGDIKTVITLIDGGAGVNAPNDSGKTPLHLAVLNNNLEIVTLLISKGANVNSKDKYDKTPLDLANSRYYKNQYIINFLISNGAKVDIVNNGKNTPLNNLEIKRIKEISTPGEEFLKKSIKEFPEKYKTDTNKFLVLGHGCDTGEEFRVPPGCTYYTRGTCGLYTYIDKFHESFTTDFIKNMDFDKNRVRQLKPHTHNTKPYSNAYRSNHMYSNTEYSLLSYYPIDIIDSINITDSLDIIKDQIKNKLMKWPYILPSGIVEYRENSDDFKYNLSMYSLLFDDNNFDDFFDSIILDDIKILPIMLKYKLDKLLSLKMKDKDFFTDLIMHAYKYSFFPNKDDVMKVYDAYKSEKPEAPITTIEQLEKLINEKFSISQVELFQHFKGTYYNIICRVPCKDTNTGRVEIRRRHSRVGGKHKKKRTRKRKSG